MSTDEVISSIQELPWEKMNPHFLVWTFYKMGQEYADSVRVAVRTYPESISVRKLAEEEIDTDNLNYDGYSQKGDHWKFLEHFLEKNNPLNISDALQNALNAGEKTVCGMSDKQRSMTVFIREKRGPGIFQIILKSHNWESLGLTYFKYYLERHIELDSEDGGHGELADQFEIDEDVALLFYQTRYDIYRNCVE